MAKAYAIVRHEMKLEELIVNQKEVRLLTLRFI